MELFVLIACAAVVFAGPVQEQTSLSLQITTWNVNKNRPPENLVDILGLQREADVLVLGLQDVIPSDPRKERWSFRNDWRLAVESIVFKNGYGRLSWSGQEGVCLGVYTKGNHSRENLTSSFLYGLFPDSGHRGGHWFRFRLDGLRLGFLTSLFTHENVSLHRRLEGFRHLENFTQGTEPQDYKFWFGDLSFQLNDQYELTSLEIADMIAKGEESDLLLLDELKSAMEEGKVFNGYSESEINFKPTYKFEVGTNRYDLSRRPAWTDRVLYRAAPGRDITTVYYGSISHLNISDHKPVEAFFRIPLGPKQKD